MDKYEFLNLFLKYNGLPREMYLDYGKSIIQKYSELIDNEEVTLFHGFFCLISGKENTIHYILVPYTGTQQELQQDPAFKEYHSWRALAEKRTCARCKKIYFISDELDNCPYCKN